MTSAPILRSSALQKSLAQAPVKRTASPTTFASTLAQAKTTTVSKKPTPMAAPVNRASQGSGAVPFQDLIVAAVNEGIRKVDEAMAGQLGSLTGGLKIPGLL